MEHELIKPDHPFTNLILLIEFNPHINRAFYADPHFIEHLPKLLEDEGYAPFTPSRDQAKLLTTRPPAYPYPSVGEVNHAIDQEWGVADGSHSSDPVIAVLHVQLWPIRK